MGLDKRVYIRQAIYKTEKKVLLEEERIFHNEWEADSLIRDLSPYLNAYIIGEKTLEDIKANIVCSFMCLNAYSDNACKSIKRMINHYEKLKQLIKEVENE